MSDIQRLDGNRLFLSYARSDDEPFVKRLYDDLVVRGFQVWWDRVSMPSRALTFLQEIRDAIIDVDRLILVVGPKAVTSDYVRAEWEYALSECKPVIPILRLGLGNNNNREDFGQIPSVLANFHCPDFRENRSYNGENGALTELIRLLAAPVSELGKLISVPSLPAHFLARPKDLDVIKGSVLADVQRPTVVTGTGRRTGIRGMAGIGKSVIAASLAHDCDVRRAFPDGVFWITIGQEPKLLFRQADLAKALGDESAAFGDVYSGKACLSELLTNKRGLIILDDVWDKNHVEAFDVLGSRCRMLITTRDTGLIAALGATSHDLNLLSEDASLELLKQWSGHPDLPSEARMLMSECGNLPFALALCGAMVRDGTPWTDVLEAFQETDLEFIKKDFPNYPYKDVLKSLKVSIDALEKTQANRYLDLAVFPNDTSIPESAIITFWLYSSDMKARSAHELLTTLSNRALLRLDGKAPDRLVTLHDLQFDYLHATQHERLQDLHNTLLNAYIEEYKLTDWADLPQEEPYLWNHLAFHLLGAGRGNELVATSKDFKYLAFKTLARKGFATEADLIAAQQFVPGDAALSLLRRNFANMIHILNRCTTPHEITGTLYSRLQHLDILVDACKNLEHEIPHPFVTTRYLLPDLPHSALIRTLVGHQGSINSCAINSRKGIIVTASDDGSIKIWDVQTGLERFTLAGHKSFVNKCAINETGDFVISASTDGTLKLWDIERQVEHHPLLPDNEEAISACSVSPIGNFIVCGSVEGTLTIWDSENRTKLQSWRGHNAPINDCAISSPKYNFIVVTASSDGTLKIWNPQSGVEQFSPLKVDGESVTCCAVNPEGTLIVFGSANGTLKVWDVENRIERFTLIGHKNASIIHSCAISPTGEFIVSAASDTTLKLWDMKTGQEYLTLTGHTSNVYGCAIDLTGDLIVSASSDKTLKLWDPKTRVSSLTTYERTMKCCAISLSGKHVVSGSSDGTLKLWDGENGTQVRSWSSQKKIMCCAISPSGALVVSGSSNGTLKLWDIQNGIELHSWPGNGRSINSCAVNDSLVVSASSDGFLTFWNIQDGNVIRSWQAHEESIYGCAMSGNLVVSASRNGTLKLWDTNTGALQWVAQEHKGEVNGCAIRGNLIVSASSDKTLKLWDVNTGAARRTLMGHKEKVEGCTISSSGDLIISVSSDQSLRVWKASQDDCVATLFVNGSLYGCAMSEDEKHIVAVGESGLYFFKLIS